MQLLYRQLLCGLEVYWVNSLCFAIVHFFFVISIMTLYFSKLFIHLTQSILDTYYCHFFFHQFSLCEIEMISHATIYCWAGALFCLLQSFFSFLLKLMLLLAFAKNVTYFFRFYIWIKENFFTISCSTFFLLSWNCFVVVVCERK